jgi:excisionase family DNA binding protein
MERPRLMSVSEAAADLHVSEAYVRRLLIERQLYGIKIGPVWAIFPNDLDAFKQIRRPPGRPAKAPVSTREREDAERVAGERKHDRTDHLLRRWGRKSPRTGT